MNAQVPIITLDGPSGSGKGTICQMLARRLGYRFLDSGVLYRLLGLAAHRHTVALDDVKALTRLAAHLDINFEIEEDTEFKVYLEGELVTSEIRTEDAGADASVVAAIPSVRKALLKRQRTFATEPGLVADGRDMGTVVFPNAQVKIFLDAGAEVRAKRRHKQLLENGENVTLAALVEQVQARDERDLNRSVAPLVPAGDATVIDTSSMTVEQTLNAVLAVISERSVEKGAEKDVG